jgi:hypothetical protein
MLAEISSETQTNSKRIIDVPYTSSTALNPGKRNNPEEGQT